MCRMKLGSLLVGQVFRVIVAEPRKARFPGSLEEGQVEPGSGVGDCRGFRETGTPSRIFRRNPRAKGWRAG